MGAHQRAEGEISAASTRLRLRFYSFPKHMGREVWFMLGEKVVEMWNIWT